MTVGLATAAPARACSVCACGDPLLLASDPAAITGRLRLQIDTEYLRVDAGTDGQPGSTDRLNQWSYRFNAVYRPIDGLAFTATVPLVTKSIRTVGGGEEVLASDLTGLGDLEVAGCYTLWRAVDLGHARSNELAVTAGTALPTGSHDASAAGALVDGQLGTGAWAPFLGLNYLVEGSSWVAFANVSGRLRAEGAYFDGSRYKSATRCSGASTDSIARCGSSRSTSAWTAATGTDRWKVRAGAGAHGGGHSGSCGGAAVLGRTPHDGFSDTSSN